MTDTERNEFIARKLAEGLSLSDVQKALVDECGIRMTYLDLRLLSSELEVDWHKQDDEKAAQAKLVPDVTAEPEAAGGTKIEVSKLVRPGAAMSGDVEFASGAKAEWFLDAYGRLGLNPAEGSAQPTEEDLQEFQTELQKKLSGGM